MRHAAKGMGRPRGIERGKKLWPPKKLLAADKVNVDALIVNVGKSADCIRRVRQEHSGTRGTHGRIDKIVDAIVM